MELMGKTADAAGKGADLVVWLDVCCYIGLAIRSPNK